MVGRWLGNESSMETDCGLRETHAPRLSPRTLTMFLEPLGYHAAKAVVPEVVPLDNPESAVLQPLARDHLEGATVGLAFLVDSDRGCLDSQGFV